MTNEMFMRIILALITIIGTLVTAYVVPFIRTKIASEQLDQLSYYISVAVRCAEQIFTTKQWKEKKQYVTDYAIKVISSKLSIQLTEEELDTIIEGIVNEIKHGDGDK